MDELDDEALMAEMADAADAEIGLGDELAALAVPG